MASRWEQLNGSLESSSAPQCPACYVCISGGKVVYVGQTINLSERVYTHGFRWVPDFNKYPDGGSYQTKWGVFSDFRIKFKTGGKYGEWAMTELRLIRRLQPKFNLRCKGLSVKTS